MKNDNFDFAIYGEVWALFRFKGEQSWSNSGCLCLPCSWYRKSDIRGFCYSYIGAVNKIEISCNFEFAVKVGSHVFLIVEQDGKFGLPDDLVD